jgi:uncharacterized protein YcbK (DUF882 family)
MARARTVAPLAVAGGFGILSCLAFAHHAVSAEHDARAAPQSSAQTTSALSAVEASPAPLLVPVSASPLDSPFSRLQPLRFTNENTRESATVQLYDALGHVNEQAALRLDALLCDTRDPKTRATLTLDRRTLQLAVRAALHFHADEVQVVSAYRKPGRRREGPHATGKAIDFKLPKVPARELAAYLRTLPRVGVGIYTHPRTSYVHLDDREHSFHWLDASPPGRTYREQSIGNASIGKRDAAYARADDWPEGMIPPRDTPQ